MAPNTIGFRIMEKNMKTTIVHGGYIEIMEKMVTTILYWGYIWENGKDNGNHPQ